MKEMNFIKYACFLLLIVLFSSLALYAQNNLPVPPYNQNQLFYVQKSTNNNTMIYELNYKNGLLDEKDPIHPYWIRYAEQGQKEELNYLQRRYAYGIKSTLSTKDKYEFHLVSFKKCTLTLAKGADNKYNVYTIINKKQAILNRIFVKIKGGTAWSPNVEYLEVKGTDTATGKELVERIKI